MRVRIQAENIRKHLSTTEPPDTDVAAVADAIVKVINMPFGTCPLTSLNKLFRSIFGGKLSAV